MSSAKWRPLCLDLNVVSQWSPWRLYATPDLNELMFTPWYCSGDHKMNIFQSMIDILLWTIASAYNTVLAF